MRQDTELQRLTAARPAILDRTHSVVSRADQERILLQILSDPRTGHTPDRHLSDRTFAARWRSRRIIIRTSVAAASVAATIAVGTALAINAHGPSGVRIGPPGNRVILDAKVVLVRSIRALSQLGDAVEFSHESGSLNGRPYTSDLWVYRAAERQRLTGPGRSDTEGWQSITGGTLARGYIYYDSKTWTEYTNPADPAWLKVSRTPTARLEARFLKSVLDSGRWTVAGHVVLGGREAIVIKATEVFPGKPGSMADASRMRPTTRHRRVSPTVPAGPLIDVAPSLTPWQVAQAMAHGQTTFTPTGTVTRTLYITAKTYLPILEKDVTRLTSQGVPDSAAKQVVTMTFRWLPVNPANLTLVKPPTVPAGYTRVNPSGQ